MGYHPPMSGVSRASLGAAGVLALAVAFVFYTLRDYGPESAVRRFHRAVQVRYWTDLRRVTVQPLESPSVQHLAAEVARLTQGTHRHRLVRMDRGRDQARAAVVYSYPGGLREVRIWIVELQGRTWKVDADKTLTTLRDALELRTLPPR